MTMRTVASFRHNGRIIDNPQSGTALALGYAFLYKPYIDGEEIPVT